MTFCGLVATGMGIKDHSQAESLTIPHTAMLELGPATAWAVHIATYATMVPIALVRPDRMSKIEQIAAPMKEAVLEVKARAF